MPESSTAPVIDWDLGTQLVGGKRDIAEEMMNLLIESLPEHQAVLTQAFDKKDWEQLAQAAHKLHGAACYCGTPRLKQAARELELATKSNQDENVTVLYHHLLDEIEAILATAS